MAVPTDLIIGMVIALLLAIIGSIALAAADATTLLIIITVGLWAAFAASGGYLIYKAVH